MFARGKSKIADHMLQKHDIYKYKAFTLHLFPIYNISYMYTLYLYSLNRVASSVLKVVFWLIGGPLGRNLAVVKGPKRSLNYMFTSRELMFGSRIMACSCPSYLVTRIFCFGYPLCILHTAYCAIYSILSAILRKEHVKCTLYASINISMI